jgi:hypothetical protein
MPSGPKIPRRRSHRGAAHRRKSNLHRVMEGGAIRALSTVRLGGLASRATAPAA